MTRVLIYEPQLELGNQMRIELEKKHLGVVLCSDPAQAQSILEKQYFHLCLWRVGTLSEINFFYSLKQKRPNTAIVATSTISSPQLIVECLHAGCSHFWNVETPLEDFCSLIDQTLSRYIFVEESLDEMEQDCSIPGFIGRHPSITKISQLVLNIRNTDSTVLITGESGTGKEIIVRAIHDLSPRSKEPFVAVNCSAIPATLLESELFGHAKGAFTGAIQNRSGRFKLAGNGTLFLDEISELPVDLQAKILRAIQNRVFEPLGCAQSVHLGARVIAASNQDLQTAVREKRFREDLFYRLNVIPIHLPPLRSRKSDIPLLVRNFLERFCLQNNKSILGISEEAMKALMRYHWPGNIRELENMIERVVVLKKTCNAIELSDLPDEQFRQVHLAGFTSRFFLPDEGINFNEMVNDFENELILQALQKTQGNKNQAAHLLHLNRTTLVEKLKRKRLQILS